MYADDRGPRRPPPRDDDDDRPRRSRPRDDDDDYDRPRRPARRDDDDDDYDRPRRSRDDYDDDYDDRRRDDRDFKPKKNTKAQRRACGVGMTLYFVRYLVAGASLGILVLAILIALIGALSRSISMLGVAGVIMMIGMFGAYFAAPILGVIAGAFALRAPSKSGAAGLGIAALALEAGILLCVFLYIFLVGLTVATRDPFGAGAMAIVMPLLMFLFFIGGFVVQMIMFRMLAIYVKDRASTNQTLPYMITFLCIAVGGPVLVFLMGILLARAGPAAGIVVFAIGIGLLVVLAMILFRIAFLVRDIRSQL